ncbi:hypothetical protein [Nocardiopsis sp. RV163]|uniref:hypothetical protein n=1 Tax=Nocardiopsis sp. RV163 TaxID=1661388 RepID=UPI00064C02BD|nr:hypothetical protein [Nocardiopsis sp. RV163]
MRSTPRKSPFTSASLRTALVRDLPGRAEAPVPGPFPGRWPTAVSLAAAPPLLLAGELLKAPHHFFFPDQIAAYADDPVKMAWGYGLWFAGLLFLVPAFTGLATAIARTRPVLGAVTGIVCLFGLMVGAFFEGANFVALQLTDAHSPELATAFVGFLYPRVHVVYALVWAPNLGWVLLAAGLLATRSVGAARFLCVLSMALHANGILKGFVPVGAVMDALLCVAFVTLAVQVLRHRERAPHTS